MSSPHFAIKLDCQHPRKNFHIYFFCGDTPKLRAYTFIDGERWTPPSDWIATIGYGTDFEQSTSIHEVNGSPAYSLDSSSSSSNSSDILPPESYYNYFEFEFDASDIATPGDYYAQIIIKDSLDSERFVFGEGMLHVKDSPIGGSHTDLTLTSTVNWSLITNTGTLPWDSDTGITIDTDCTTNPIELTIADISKTRIWNGDCDMTYTLPAVSSDTIGALYKFINLTSYVLTIRAQSGETIDTYPAMYSGQGLVNTNPSYERGKVAIKQITGTLYASVEGKGTWTYLDT